jgi:hypothetical protein
LTETFNNKTRQTIEVQFWSKSKWLVQFTNWHTMPIFWYVQSYLLWENSRFILFFMRLSTLPTRSSRVWFLNQKVMICKLSWQIFRIGVDYLWCKVALMAHMFSLPNLQHRLLRITTITKQAGITLLPKSLLIPKKISLTCLLVFQVVWMILEF